MKIQKITLVNNIANKQTTPQKREIIQSNNYSYNPIAYRDFNLSFTADQQKDYRKHWTPEEFYDLPSNKANMPQTMKSYLTADYAARYHQSPIRVMSEAFERIEDAKNLDEVKEMFPNEKLFANLTSKPNRLARTGILAEQRIFGDIGPLFADGSDDLGIYILKKIYLEGKQLPEINKDFQKDISDVYKGALSEIKDEDVYAYGIKRPNFSFWNSLTHNREDFPYEYKPRTAIERLAGNSNTVKKVYVPHTRYKKPQINSLTDHILDMWKDVPPEQSERKLKRLKLGDEGETFFHRFKGPIGTIAADKINLGQKLSEFMTKGFLPENLKNIMLDLEKEDAILLDFDNPNDKIKAIMRTFWKQNPDLKIELGNAVRQTIQEFETAYEKGEDSAEFLDMIKKADELKDKKAVRMTEYARLRRERLKLEALNKPKVESPISYAPKVEIKPAAEPVLTLKDKFKKHIFSMSEFIPDSYANSYYRFLERNTLITDEIMLDCINGGSEKSVEVFQHVDDLLNQKALHKTQAVQQAIIDYLATTCVKDNVHNLYPLDINVISELAKKSGINGTPQAKQFINSQYTEYSKPLDNQKTIDNIAKKIVSLMAEFKPRDVHSKETGGLAALLAKNIQDNPAYKSNFEKLLKKTRFIQTYGSSAKVLLNENMSKKELFSKLENIIIHFISNNAHENQLGKMLIANPKATDDILKFSYHDCYVLVKGLEHRIKGFI